uniref:INTS5_N domain-containing protein n=1 Tax=Caenorhabditis japonica TaxID=281687 RepID=A0A8R1IHV1_CAEJA
MTMNEPTGDENHRFEAKGKEIPELKQKYIHTSELYESFLQISSFGDVVSIYRNRPYFQNQKKHSLVSPATEVFLNVPASRSAVYHYTGLLVHESVHYWFNKKENNQTLASFSSVKESSVRLLDFFINFFEDSTGSSGLRDVLTWMCELSAELSSRNVGRPAMVHYQQHEKILEIFKSNDVVAKLISLMNLVVIKLIDKNPDACMKVLFETSRHGPQFSWMWLHIATIRNLYVKLILKFC